MSPQLRLKSAQGGTRQVRLPDLQCGASLAEATTGDPSAPCHIYNIRTKFYIYSDDTHTHTHTHTPCLRQGGARKNEMKMRMNGG